MPTIRLFVEGEREKGIGGLGGGANREINGRANADENSDVEHMDVRIKY